jgi:hypothetical protein
MTPLTTAPNARPTARLAAAALLAATFAIAPLAAALLIIEATAPASAQKRKSVPQPSPELPAESSGDVGESGDLGEVVVDPEAEGMVDAPADAAAPDDLDVGSGDGPIDPASAGVRAKLDETPGPPIELAAGATVVPGVFLLQARLDRDGSPLPSGVTFRVYSDQLGTDGRLPQLGEAEGGTAALNLQPGTYLVHASYGRAGATKRVHVDPSSPGDTVVLNAGGMRLTALVGADQRLPSQLVRFDIYAPDEEGSDERALLVENAPPDKIIGLNAGIYHVVSRYGDANAVVRADIKVEPGKLTEATVYQKAARLTLKLVDEHGGEAIADTAWTVVTSLGDNVIENVGAFPSVVLAIGDYKAIARHDGRTFERTFTVEAGLDRDIEVIAK